MKIASNSVDVTCAIVIVNGKILATQRSENMKLPLKWEFPGGKIEPNETAEACICRELREELNIEIEILERLKPQRFDYETISINLIHFVANLVSGEVTLQEHRDFKWLSTDQLRLLDWALADIPILDLFLKSDYASGRTI